MMQRFKSWYKTHKVLFWILTGLFAAYCLAGFVAVPLTVHHILDRKVSQILSRQVRADQVRANPFTFSLRLRDIRITKDNGVPLAAVGQLYVNIDPLTSLFKWGGVVKSVQIDSPRLNLVRTAPDRFNFSDMFPPSSPTNNDAAPQEAARPMRLVLDQLAINKGEITFTDETHTTAFKTSVSELNLNVQDLDSHAEAGAAIFGLTARTDTDEGIRVDGKTDLSPLTCEADLRLTDLKIPKYMPYLSSYLDARITDGGVDLGARLTWSDAIQSVDGIELVIADLVLKGVAAEQEMVVIPEFKVAGAGLDLKAQQIRLGRISSRGARIDVHLDDRGTLNLATIVRPAGGKTMAADAEDAETPSSDPAWVITIPELSVDDATVQFLDEQTDPPAQLMLRQIALKAEQLTTAKDRRGSAELRLEWADQGRLAVNGEVGLTPFQAALDVSAEQMDIRPLQPYVKPFAHLVLTKGAFNTDGRLEIVPVDQGMDIQYRGQAALNDFQSVDPVQAKDFLKWQSLYLTGLELGTAPFRLVVSDMALTDFYNRLIIDDQGRSNLEAILNRASAADPQTDSTVASTVKEAPPPEEASTTAPDISIKSVTLQGGQVDFSDAFVKPKVHLPMSQIGGRISGLDAIKTHKADVLLRGMVNKRVPMEIKGQINPLIAKPFVDLTLSMAGIDLSPLTPYSGKYLGYKLDKGQLTMNLTYLVDDNKLTGQNKILLHQLTLGETVASPKATKLPIKLALALLKDRKGDIDLDLPVSGDLENPEFSIGGIIGKMFVNLIVSIVSSPFKMLGALFGGGEELAFLDFDAGMGAIAPEKREQLDTLAKILHERPGLKLEIQGRVDPETDKEGLRKVRFEHQLKAAKLKQLVAGGQKAVPLERIQLTAEEHAGLVREAFAVAEFPKPRDAKGQLKKISIPEMEKLLYTAIEVTPDDLRILAHERAAAAKDYLLNQAGVDAARLFVIEPKLAGDDAGQASKQQVKFSLK